MGLKRVLQEMEYIVGGANFCGGQNARKIVLARPSIPLLRLPIAERGVLCILEDTHRLCRGKPTVSGLTIAEAIPLDEDLLLSVGGRST